MKLLDKMRRKRIATLKAEIKEYEECYKEIYELLGYKDEWVLRGIVFRQDEVARLERKLRRKKAKK